jgi:3-phenylpropionate/trans-cinnamate dioxygenase ferredoxin reductase component
MAMFDPSGPPILIVGASAAGIAAARTLRSEGYSGPVTIIDRDPDMPYERPPLTKSSFAVSDAHVPLITPEELDELQIALIAGHAVETIEPALPSLQLGDGRLLIGQAILVATGGTPTMPSVPDSELEGVYGLRTMRDRRAIWGSLDERSRVAIVGGGLIGAECVAACLAAGHSVDWVDMAASPLAHIVPSPIATFLVNALLSEGARLHSAQKLIGFGQAKGRVFSALLDNDIELSVETVIVGIGTRPEVPQGLGTGGHLNVDSRQRTSYPKIYAAGDVAVRTTADGTQTQCHHWREAQWQGSNAACAMLGKPEPNPEPSWFWSDQNDRHLEMVGRISSENSRFVRNVGTGSIASFELDDGRLVGVASVNDIGCVRAARRALGKLPPFSPELFADPASDPRKLLQEMTR